MGKSLNAHELLKSIKEKSEFDAASPVYAGFCALWVEKNCQADLEHYVKNQTIELPD